MKPYNNPYVKLFDMSKTAQHNPYIKLFSNSKTERDQ